MGAQFVVWHTCRTELRIGNGRCHQSLKSLGSQSIGFLAQLTKLTNSSPQVCKINPFMSCVIWRAHAFKSNLSKNSNQAKVVGTPENDRTFPSHHNVLTFAEYSMSIALCDIITWVMTLLPLRGGFCSCSNASIKFPLASRWASRALISLANFAASFSACRP